MKASRFFNLVAVAAILTLSMNCNKDNPSPDDHSDPALSISALSTYSAMPSSQLLITGAGFKDEKDLWVRFSDNDYQFDVPVLQCNGTKLLVTVPPFINTGTEEFETGVVSVRVIRKNNQEENASNPISNFVILDLPLSQAEAGMVTLIFVKEQLRYLKQLQLEMVGTEMATPAMTGSVATSVSNLVALKLTLEEIVNDQGGNEAFFVFGSLRGEEIKIGLKDLSRCDRLILAMYSCLGDPDLTDPFGPGDYKSELVYNPCQGEAMNAINDLTSGQNNNAVSGDLNCMASSLPQAINTAGKVVLGAGSVGLGVVALFALGFEVPVAAVVALPAAAILYATVGTAGLEVVTGAVLKNINSEAAKNAIHSGVGKIESTLRDMMLGQVIPDAAGAMKSLYDGYVSLGEAFSATNTGAGCTYSLSAPSIQFEYAGGSGNVTVTAGSGCSWTATSSESWITVSDGSSGIGNGTVTYTVQSNASTQARTGSILIADKSFTINQDGGTQAGPYDGSWSLTMSGTFVNPDVQPSTWPFPETTFSGMGIIGNDIYGWGDGGMDAINDDGYAEWECNYSVSIMRFSGTFYSFGTGVGSWDYGPDMAGTTASGTWSATRQ